MRTATILAIASANIGAATVARLRASGSSSVSIASASSAAGRTGALDREGELLCRVRPGDGAGGRPLDVWLLPGNARAVAFEDALTYEATVHCVGSQPECRAKQTDTTQLFGNAAQGDSDLVPDDVVANIGECPECPCEMDTQQHILESQRAIVEAVQPKCTVARRAKPVDILMIGLGGGVVHSLVRSSCPEGTRVRSVEIDPRFAAAAGRYFGLPLQRGISEVVVGDAFAVVEKEVQALKGRKTPGPEGSVKALNDALADDDEPPALGADGYDIVVVDCFVGGGETPEACRSADFVDDLNKILKPGGEVIQHLWHTSPQKSAVAFQYNNTRQEYDETFGSDSVETRPIFRQNRSLMFDNLVFASKTN